MDLLDLLLQEGDRVRIIQGEFQGKTGTIIDINHSNKSANVKGDGGATKLFPLSYLAHLPTANGVSRPPGSTADLEGLQSGSPPGSTADLEGLQLAIAVLEAECTNLRSTALADCWIKSWKRKSSEYHRLHFTVASGKSPEYVEAKDVPELQKRINDGRKLKTLQAAIAILRAKIDP